VKGSRRKRKRGCSPTAVGAREGKDKIPEFQGKGFHVGPVPTSTWPRPGYWHATLFLNSLQTSYLNHAEVLQGAACLRHGQRDKADRGAVPVPTGRESEDVETTSPLFGSEKHSVERHP
jgi:hypothetical protein